MNATALRRTYAYAVTILLALAILSPVLADSRSDSFPLSTFPMFSGRRSADVSISHVVGTTESGERVVLPPAALNTDEVVQAFETVRQAVAQGPASTQALCTEAAEWAADHREGLRSIAVVTDEFDAIAYFDGDKDPQSTQTHATCQVVP